MELSKRHRDVLAAIVREYIISGETVGSRTLVRRHGLEQSPATVRNVMADLEAEGLLLQPHTSAGRMPTECGLRFYVDRLMKMRELTTEERREILGRYQLTDVQLDVLLREISRLLADASQQCAVVLVPRSETTVLKRVEFVPIGEERVIAVLVMSSGLVQNRLLRVRIPADELRHATNYLNDLCADMELAEVRRTLQLAIDSDQSRYDRLASQALELGARTLEAESADELVIEGKARLLDHPQIDHEQMKALLTGIEEKRTVLRLLDETMAAEGVQVFIGAETHRQELQHCAVIAAAYGGARPLGTLGVIGPSAMDYPRLISLVDFTAGLLTQVLQR